MAGCDVLLTGPFPGKISVYCVQRKFSDRNVKNFSVKELAQFFCHPSVTNFRRKVIFTVRELG
jgi:hypothetical protein